MGFIGAGRVAGSLAVALRQAGYAVSAVASRTIASAEHLAARVEGCSICQNNQAVVDSCKLVFITTPDDVIPAVASRLRWHPGQVAVHCSGADSAEVLSTAASQGAAVGVFHPLQTFAGGKADTTGLQGITFSLEAQEPLLAELKDIAQMLGGHWIVLRAEDRALYHTSAVIASNYLVALISTAASLWETFGTNAQVATSALLPLMKRTLDNIERVGLPGCLSGPIARGDAGTIRRHLQAIRAHAPNLEVMYRELGQITLSIARTTRRLDVATIEDLSKALAG